MNLKQAKQRFARLGFVFNNSDVPNWGRRDLTEAFDFTPNHLLNIPYRDVYIGKAVGGWYISSHINFRGRLYRHRSYNAAWMNRRNIFGLGDNLRAAVYDFEAQFRVNELINAPRPKA